MPLKSVAIDLGVFSDLLPGGGANISRLAFENTRSALDETER